MRFRLLGALAAALLTAGIVYAVEPYNTAARWICFTGTCTIGDTRADAIELVTDGADLELDVTSNTLDLEATTTSTAVFTGSDAAGAANTQYDTTGAGQVTVGSADVTAVILNADADVQIQNGATGNVDLSFHDYADSADDDMAHALIRVNCTTATTGAEDCDFSVGVAEAGNAADTRIAIDADGGVDLGSASTNDFTVTTDGAGLDLDGTANALTLTATSTNTATFVGADAASPANTALDTTGAGAITIGSADVTAVTITTDDTGDGSDLVLPADSVGTAELTRPGFGSFNICGEATTVNNNTVYYGAASDAGGGPIILTANVLNGQGCSIDAAGSTTEADEDEYVFTNQAFGVASMICRNEADANAAITYTLRTAAGATVPSVTCTIADNERDCVADVQTTTDIAAGATVALAVSSSSDIGDNNGFVCQVNIVF